MAICEKNRLNLYVLGYEFLLGLLGFQDQEVSVYFSPLSLPYTCFSLYLTLSLSRVHEPSCRLAQIGGDWEFYSCVDLLQKRLPILYHRSSCQDLSLDLVR